jgi:hypothetical protein
MKKHKQINDQMSHGIWIGLVDSAFDQLKESLFDELREIIIDHNFRNIWKGIRTVSEEQLEDLK